MLPYNTGARRLSVRLSTDLTGATLGDLKNAVSLRGTRIIFSL